jgi:hypothetical protein
MHAAQRHRDGAWRGRADADGMPGGDRLRQPVWPAALRLVNRFVGRFVVQIVGRFVAYFIGRFIDYFIGWFIDQFIAESIGQSID